MVAGSVTIRATGATAFTVTVNDAVAVCPWPSLAVMVTVWAGVSSEAGLVHDHVPAPVLVTVPVEAERATVSPSGSEKVPALVGAAPSPALTAAVGAANAGGELGVAASPGLDAK